MKGKLVKITVLFFIVMILFTILSRVTYNMSMATVETTQPARETMGPVIETKATVEGKKEVALNTKENQIIESILVTIGQAVEKDQVLYTLDLKELNKQIKEKSQELELNKVQLANAQPYSLRLTHSSFRSVRQRVIMTERLQKVMQQYSGRRKN